MVSKEPINNLNIIYVCFNMAWQTLLDTSSFWYLLPSRSLKIYGIPIIYEIEISLRLTFF